MEYDVFISYRRGENDNNYDGNSVSFLKSRLERQLSNKGIYLDIHGKPSGESIRREIMEHIRSSQVFVIFINKNWVESINRLYDSNDIVREEIELALKLDLIILPIVVAGGRLPEISELPESLWPIKDRQVTFDKDFKSYEEAVDEFAKLIKSTIPTRTVKLLNWLAINESVNIVLTLMVLGAVLLFTSRMLDLHLIDYSAEVVADIGTVSSLDTVINKEVGVLMALNWTLVLIVITPVMLHLATRTLKVAKELLDRLQVNQMIYYVGNQGRKTPITARKLWETVVRPTSIWCKVFLAIGIVLSFVQWWQYSGQWYLKDFDFKTFMQTSTGPDWHIAWTLGIVGLESSGLSTILFALLMYLAYGVGSVITFSFYAFLLNFSSVLNNLASNVGATAKEVLILDQRDCAKGGLGDFERIQNYHAAFCYWSAAALYVMALRNAYLPMVCRVPESIAGYSPNIESMLRHCSSMGEFLLLILISTKSFFEDIIAGRLNLDTLFFTYSEQNLFIIGSLLHISMIAGFYYFISARMHTIIESAQEKINSNIATELLRKISLENIKTLLILFFAALSTVFLNLGFVLIVIVLFAILIRYLIDRILQIL